LRLGGELAGFALADAGRRPSRAVLHWGVIGSPVEPPIISGGPQLLAELPVGDLANVFR